MRRFVMSIAVLFALGTAAQAELDTITYVSVDGAGMGAVEGDTTGKGPVTLLDNDGGDLWNGGDNFIYLHHDAKIVGDFSATVRVVSQTEAIDGRWGKSGIHARASLDPNSQNAMAQLATGNGSQLDAPAMGDHNPVPARLAGRVNNDGTGGYEDPIIASPLTQQDVSGDNIANNTFQTGGTVPTWLRLIYDSSENSFVSATAADVGGRPGVWSFSAPRTNVLAPPPRQPGWWLGLGYSAHGDLNFDQVTRTDMLHGVTFDNYSMVPFVVPEPTTIGLVLLGILSMLGLTRRRR